MNARLGKIGCRLTPSLTRVGVVAATAWFVAEARAADFMADVKPVLENHCVGCHNPSVSKGELSLATRDEALRGGESGAAMVAGDAGRSRLVRMISPDETGHARMPEDAPALSAEQIDALRGWIDAGAEWPEGVTLRETS
ncbi:MAG: c-type cytochrome domain-containing protein, partial [Planctomycetota bacterium]